MFNLKSQRGAMFGLDARIALAIFGGLSVITGAALFGSISQTKITALTTEFDNFSKAYTNVVLDTGIDTLDFRDLYTDQSVTVGWNGPYITRPSASHTIYGTYSLWGGQTTDGSAVPAELGCASGTPQVIAASPSDNCAVWLVLSNIEQQIGENLEKVIDGTTAAAADLTNGNLRWVGDTVYYKIARIQ